MKDKLNKINWHLNLWIWYGRLSPILFLIGAFALYQILNTDVPFIFFTAWTIFVATGIVWWSWVIKVLLDMVSMFHDISEHVQHIQNSLKEVKEDIKFLDNTRND
jgi:cobalamin biosynthesis protein CobD/CbiB